MTIASDLRRPSPGRIVFLCPDAESPYGGIKVIYQMVDALVDAGFDAYVWHADPSMEISWFSHKTPALKTPSLKLERPDILVVPEMLGPSYAQTAHKANVVILNQGHFHVFRGAGLRSDWPGKYPGWPNAVAVVATSKAIEAFTEFVVRDEIPVFSVSLSIDSDVFKPSEKQQRIVVLTRRRYPDVEIILQLLHRSSKIHNWEVLPIDGLGQKEFGKLLGTSRIFISLSDREGLGLPPAEAMAAGCYVVGFTGDGGREFMLPEFCSPVDDPNLLGLVKEVERVTELWATEPAVMNQRVNSARDFVLAHFSYENFRESLISTFEELTGTGSAAHQKQEFHLLHYSAIKPPSAFERLLASVSPWIPTGLSRYWNRRRNPNGEI